jgi:hypothetical protein
MTRRAGLAIAAALFLAAATAVVARTGENERFPHEKHARLFPLCIGCHAGIVEGTWRRRSRIRPRAPAATTACGRSRWTGPAPRRA